VWVFDKVYGATLRVGLYAIVYFMSFVLRLIGFVVKKIFGCVINAIEATEPVFQGVMGEFVEDTLASQMPGNVADAVLPPNWAAGVKSSVTTIQDAVQAVGGDPATNLGLDATKGARERHHQAIAVQALGQYQQLAQQFDGNFEGVIRNSMRHATRQASQRLASPQIEEFSQRCSQFLEAFRNLIKLETAAAGRGQGTIWQVRQRIGDVWNNSGPTWRDFINVIDWVAWVFAWVTRLVALLVALGLGLMTGPGALVLTPAILMLAADIIDVVYGGVKVMLAIMGEVFSKDLSALLAFIAPGLMAAGAFHETVKTPHYATVEKIWNEGLLSRITSIRLEDLGMAIGNFCGRVADWVTSTAQSLWEWLNS
jgi:hypothetical protein